MKLLFVILLISSVTACVPGVEDYYKPSASGGKAINDHCGAFIAPQSTLQFTPESIDVRAESLGTFLYLQIRVPEGTTVAIEKPQIIVAKSMGEHSVPLDSFRYTNIEERKDESIPANENIVGKNDTFLFGNVEPRIYSTSAEFPQEMGNIFTVQLPTFTINGKNHEFPVIQFSKGKGFGVYPVNC